MDYFTGTLREINRQKDPSRFLPIIGRVMQNRVKLDYQKIITLNLTKEDGILYGYFMEESQILILAIFDYP